MKIAILITGELRSKYLNNLIESINNYDVYISTYHEYKKRAKIITDVSRIKFVDRRDLKCESTNMCQWFHLKNLLKNFKSKLESYDVLVKIRSDCYFFEPIKNEHFNNIENNYFYINSDHSFYAKTTTFYDVLWDFWKTINLEYLLNSNKYYPINYMNLLYSFNNIYCSNYTNYYFEKYIKKKLINERYTDTYGRHDLKINYNNINSVVNLNIRMNLFPGIIEQIYPKQIYNKEINKLLNNIINYKDDVSNFRKFRNQNRSKNKVFGSEKFFFLHVINKVEIKPYVLPTIGVISDK